MKQLKYLVVLAFINLSSWLFAQQTPTTGTAPLANANFWTRAGNNTVGGNIFGTQYNSPIYTIAGPGGAADFGKKFGAMP